MAESSTPADPVPSSDLLHDIAWEAVFLYLDDPKDLCSVSLVSRQCRDIINRGTVWDKLNKKMVL